MKKIFLLIFIAAFTIPVQKIFAQAPKPAVLNHMAIVVTDLKKSTEFYENLFHLEIGPEPFHDRKHTWFNLGPGLRLHVIQGAKTTLVYEKNEHLCFAVPSVEEFVKTLKSRNIQFENAAGAANTVTARVDGVKQIYFKDPDGHWIEVNDAKD